MYNKALNETDVFLLSVW